MSRPVTQQTLDLIKGFEGFRDKAYKCPAGVWTIGYGATQWGNGQPVKPGETISESDALDLLSEQVRSFQDGLYKLVKVTLNANQESALVSWAYNVGLGAVKGSTLLRLLNEGKYLAAGEQLLRWDKGPNGIPIAGLSRRRQAEFALYRRK